MDEVRRHQGEGEEELADEEIDLPGFRFFPTEEELVSFYLHNQLLGRRRDMHRVIPVVDIYTIEPFNLSRYSGERCRRDSEQWFFFVKQQEREARGGRPNRTTSSRSGYWKATGSPSYVYSSDNRVIGVKKMMVFYRGKAPTGRKTKWKMHEYKAIQDNTATSSSTPTPQKTTLGSCDMNSVCAEFTSCREPSEHLIGGR